MAERYFLAPDGVEVVHSSDEDHADIGRRVLAEQGITPKDYSDIYDQMSALNFARVVEFPGRICCENPLGPLTGSQMDYLMELKLSGNRELQINDKHFEETRGDRSLTDDEFNERCGTEVPKADN